MFKYFAVSCNTAITLFCLYKSIDAESLQSRQISDKHKGEEQ